MLLQYNDYTEQFLYSGITNSFLLFNFDLLVAFFCGCSCKKGNKKKNVYDYKSESRDRDGVEPMVDFSFHGQY